MSASNKDGGQQGQPQDLWPDLSGIEPIRTPIVVLKEQAALLGKKTKNIVTAEVLGPKRDLAELGQPGQEDYGDYKDGSVVVSFVLVAPVLENYHFHLFSIQYSIAKPYPARIVAHIQPPPPTAMVHSEEELVEALKTIFSNRATVSAISAMIAQSTAMTPPPMPIYSG